MSVSPGKKPVKNEPGVSEIIGAILMIALVVAAVAVVAVLLNSQTTPEKIPNVNFMTGTSAPSAGKIDLYLYHNGGDALRRGEFAVVTDVDPEPVTDYSISDGSDEWSVGKNLILRDYDAANPPKSVAIVYTSGQSGSVVIKSGSSRIAELQKPIQADITPIPVGVSGGTSLGPQVIINELIQNTTLLGDALNQSPGTLGPVIADVIVSNSTNYYREADNSIDRDTSIMLKIKGSGSTFSYGSTATKTLEAGDIIVVTQARNNPESWKIFGMGDQLWEFAADGVWVDWKKASTGVWTNSSRGGTTTLYHSWITGYEDIGSTLTITASGTNDYQALVYNGVKQFEGRSDTSNGDVTIENIRPQGLGLFVLEYDHNTNSVYFVGYAEHVTWS